MTRKEGRMTSEQEAVASSYMLGVMHKNSCNRSSSMEITTLCTVMAALRVVPNRSQFFQYQSLSLSCGCQGASSGWRVKRNTSHHRNQECVNSGDGVNQSTFTIDVLYQSDSGVYWCESAAGACSDAVNITVTRGSVILESPALPVMEGHDVTLSCRARTRSSSGLTSDFYKDGVVIRRSSTGNMTISGISMDDGGSYRCNISGAGASPGSRLTVNVRAKHPRSLDSPATFIALPVGIASLSVASLALLCIWNHKDKSDSDVTYTDVTITQEGQPKRLGDTTTELTCYAQVKAGNT